MANDDEKKDDEHGDLFERNPARYRDLSVPFANHEEAIKANEAFLAEVAAARVRHRIADVHVLTHYAAIDSQGREGDYGHSAHFGDHHNAEGMLATAFGREQARHQENIAHVLRRARNGG